MDKYCPKCFKKFPSSLDECPADGTNLVSLDDRDLTGQVLDKRYTVLERIGRGGMGVVYKAEQHLIKRIVALKVLRREIVLDESVVQRFLTEAKATASLDSRRTVTLYDFGVTSDGLLYYTMELLKGRPLSSIIRDEAPIDPYRAAFLLLQVCESLEEAHEHGILHRDLKPENLYVIEKRGKEQIKVLDFGIAKLVGDIATDSITRTGMIVGTPQYLSPEQAQGNPVVPASDLYSLGIVLYEMLSGSPPFIYDTPMKTLWAHIQNPVPSLQETNPDVNVPRSVELFLRKALEKEAGKRFQSATAFRGALKRALEDHEASPETVVLSPLSTTGEGLRLKTQAWETPQGTTPPEKPSVAPHGSRDEGTGTVLLGHAPQTSPLSGRQPAESQPQSARLAAAPPKTPDDSENELETAARAGEQEVLPTDQPETGASTATEQDPDVEQLMPDGYATFVRRRHRILWGGGVVAALVLAIIVVAVWWPRPETKGFNVQADQQKAPESKQADPVSEPSAPPRAIDPTPPLDAPPEKARAEAAEAKENKQPEKDVATTTTMPCSCAGRSCGDNGCGDSCGECGTNEVCSDGGLCECGEGSAECDGMCCDPGVVCHEGACCVPDCRERECGDDQCGGSCGACPGPQNACVKGICACQPDCEGKDCGPDGCHGSCGECTQYPGSYCTAEDICACKANCDRKKCGPDGCGSSCGSCSSGDRCKHGRCERICIRECNGKECGPDGCDSSCGSCPAGDRCRHGRCEQICISECNGKECGPDGCGSSCGSCASEEECDNGRCRLICVPQCQDRECGPDGCDGSCGYCKSGSQCRKGKCVKESDLLVERGKEAMGREQYDEAINLFRKAKDKGASAGEIDGLVRKCLNKIRERECRRLVIQGERAFSAKKWSECVKHLKAVVKLGCATHDMEKKLRTCIINE